MIFHSFTEVALTLLPSDTIIPSSLHDVDPEPETEETLNAAQNTQACHAPGHCKQLHEGKGPTDSAVAAVVELIDEADDVPTLIPKDNEC